MKLNQIHVFKDAKAVGREWRWRGMARNGRVVMTSGEGYKNKGHAVAQAEAVKTAFDATQGTEVKLVVLEG